MPRISSPHQAWVEWAVWVEWVAFRDKIATPHYFTLCSHVLFHHLLRFVLILPLREEKMDQSYPNSCLILALNWQLSVL